MKPVAYNHLFDATYNQFAGRRLQQTWADLFVLNKFLNENKIDVIVELGADKGGSAFFLRNHAYVYTIDWRYEPDIQNQYNIHYYIGDVYDINTVIFVNNISQSKGRMFLFIDGGTKPKTFVEYAKTLKSGDIVFLHDYPNQYSYEVIEPIVKEHNLKQLWPLGNETPSMLIGFKK